ncbi:NACHT, LRR and PYD domains-containing protein 4 [Physocladia obscura]|uniref:NACHT, LRR and PYD domains-containing protein 4 n=1 Tax=Physocladia obscura TaxID=109957 RepID=A0AAD5T7L1_9FUNG|nr:NACHT, LRR and PYD domains-containing protein 4 [Physocladia obscura]
MSRNSMNIICKGITGNFSFFSELDLKNSRITDKSVWSDFTSALKSNTNIQTLDLSYNDVTDVPGLFEAIRDHTGLKKVLIGSAFDPMPFLSGKSVASVTFNTIDSLGLNILVDVWAIGKPFLEKLFITKFINEKENDSAFESTISKFGAFLSALPNLKEISLPEILANAAIQCLNDSLTIVSVSLIGTGTRSTATGKKSKLAKDGSATDKKNKKKVASKKKQVAEWMDPFCKAMVKCAKSKTQKEIDLELADENGERNANVLRTLYLSDLSLDDEDMYIFAESLAEITDFAVAELNLQNNEIGADGIKDVLNAFKADNKFLTSITLASNSIGPTSATAFKNFIKNATNLTDIDLSENPIGSAFEAIADAIKSLPDCALEYATFGRTNMTDDELILLSGALTSNKNIEYLDISENEFNVAGITALGQSLFANSTLTEIVLTNSLSGPNGLESIADALKNGVCAVKDLWLEKCQIRDTGAKIILESQSGERKTLRSLMLEDNEIEGGAELCALFDQHKDLFSAGIEYLWFENNLSLSGGLLKAMGPVIVAAANFAAEAKQKEKAVDDTENVDEKGTDQDEANKEGADGDNSKESVDEEASNEDNSDEEDAKEDNSDEEDVKEDNSSDQKDATKDNSDGNSEKSANQSSSEDSEDDDDTVPKGLLNLAFTGCSKIGNDAAVEMIQLLHLLNEIEIGFDDCGLDDKIVGSVCEAISNPSAHFILNLEKNKITDEGVKTISSFAETNLNSNSIDYCIYLAGNSFTSDFSKEFSEKLEKYEIYLTGDEESVEKVFEYSEST